MEETGMGSLTVIIIPESRLLPVMSVKTRYADFVSRPLKNGF